MIVCTGVLPWIVLDLIQWKTHSLFTYIRSALSATTFWFGRKKLCFSRTGFVYVTNWKNSENSSISQLCFLFVIYLKFIITLVKGMFDLQIDKKKKKCHQWISCEKNQQHIVKIFYMWMFCITLKGVKNPLVLWHYLWQKVLPWCVHGILDWRLKWLDW